MHPLVRGAAAAAAFTALGSLDRRAPEPAPVSTPAGEPRGVDGLPAPCGPGTLPEGQVCLRIPGEDEAAARATEPSPPAREASREALGADRIPRRPERPADPGAYVYPVGETGRARVLDGPADGSPGVHLAARPGEKVVLLDLPQQEGPAEVIFVGDLHGKTVVTAHTVLEGTHRRTYLLVHGGLDHPAPDLVAGAKLGGGAVLGFARTIQAGPRDDGGSAAPPRREGLIDVYLEVRELREGARLDARLDAGPDGGAPDGRRLTSASLAVPTDVRNVLPLRDGP